MIRSVAKHNYVKGRYAKAKAKAHINYLQYRPGEDRSDEPRKFFSKDVEEILGVMVKKDIERQVDRNVTMHKLILSPGLNNIDLKEYTREVMDTFGRSKGLDLDWKAVQHENTDHSHVHVVIMGRDLEGRQVRFNGREDYNLLRQIGDRYIDRERPYERYLERDYKDLLDRSDYKRDGDAAYRALFGKGDPEKLLDRSDFERRGKQDYRTLFESGQEPEKEPGREPWDKQKAIEHVPADERITVNGETYTKFSSIEKLTELDGYLKETSHQIKRDEYSQMWQWINTKDKAGEDFFEKEAKKAWEAVRDYKQFDEEFRRGFEQTEIHRSQPKGREAMYEAQGALGDSHLGFQLNDAKQNILDMIESHPERADEWKESLEYFDGLEKEYQKDREINNPLDTILLLDLGRETREQTHQKAIDRGDQTKPTGGEAIERGRETLETTPGAWQGSAEATFDAAQKFLLPADDKEKDEERDRGDEAP